LKIGVSGIVWFVSTVPACKSTGLRIADTCFIISSSWDQIRQQYVAVKKLPEPFKTPSTTQYILREIKLLKHLQHENVR
jgi:serine/threonine protein kinase